MPSPRGTVHARVRISAVRPGVLFLPFHYGYWDRPRDADDAARTRAANETTITDWDPVSKQPIFKTSCAGIRLLERGDGRPAPAPTTTASAPVGPTTVPPTTGGPRAHAHSTTGATQARRPAAPPDAPEGTQP